MGFFRILFAFTVVLTHSEKIYGYLFGNPVVAVRSFFMISGFYMALILTEKYKSYKSFIISRFLRIYPIYWVVLILTILASFLAYFTNGSWGELRTVSANIHVINPLSLIYLIFAHIAVYGRGILAFLSFNSSTGLFTFAPVHGEAGSGFLLVPQAWTIVLELLFYLLAPLINKKSTLFVILLACGSFALRYILLRLGLNGVAWNYQFFPSEFIFFAMGILAYRIYKRIVFDVRYVKIIGLVFSISLVIYLIFYNFLNFNSPISFSLFSIIPEKESLFYLLFWIALPFIFILSKKNTFDRKIGDLSYPVYISHILIWTLFYPRVFSLIHLDRSYAGILTFGLAVCFSIFVNKFIQGPIDRYRHKFSQHSNKAVRLILS